MVFNGPVRQSKNRVKIVFSFIPHDKLHRSISRIIKKWVKRGKNNGSNNKSYNQKWNSMKFVTFDCFDNSLLTSFLLRPELIERISLKEERAKALPDDEITRNLGIISSLYLYTGTPPYGYGTQAPKVAETISRAHEFNRKIHNGTFEIGFAEIQNLRRSFKDDGDFPHDQIHGNFCTREGYGTRLSNKTMPTNRLVC